MTLQKIDSLYFPLFHYVTFTVTTQSKLQRDESNKLPDTHLILEIERKFMYTRNIAVKKLPILITS